ncbi:MAG: MFS transporter [Phycisphaeraceae bacterium]|nr:MFS transporter [Phycisphaeraceae bacterium]
MRSDPPSAEAQAPTVRDLFFTRRSASLLVLGFAGGVPYTIATVSMQGAFTSAGASEAAIGALSLLLLPYTLKVLWAPLVDALLPQRLAELGRRRAWILASQAGIAASLVGVSLVTFASGEERPLLALFFGLALCMTICSATQDVAADAYRIDISPPATRAAAASVFVMGYRLALALLGAGSLIVGGWATMKWGAAFGWGITFAGLALIMPLLALGTLFAPKPEGDQPEPSSLSSRLARSVVEPFRDLAERFGSRLVALLAFIFIFKLPDNLAIPMTLPFLQRHLGYELADIGWVRQAIGLGVTIGGALIGAMLVPRLGLRRSLFVFGIVQATSTASFAWLAMHAAAVAPDAPGIPALIIAVVIEYLGIGLVTAGFVAFLMSLCTPRYSATQYALLTAVMTLGVALAGAQSGNIFQWLLAASDGDATAAWFRFFLLCVASGAIGLALIPWVTERRFRAPRAVPPRAAP